MAVEVLQDEADKVQFDATYIKGLNADFRYRWVRKQDVNITRKQLMGYEIVTRSTEEHAISDRTRIKKPEDVSTQIEWGDMILMRIPMEKFEGRLAAKRARILRQTKGVAQAYKDAIARLSPRDENPAFEEHHDKARYTGEVTEHEFAREMNSMPEVEGPKIGRMR